MKLSDTEPQRGEEVLKDAELAMYHAKRGGGDRIDVFKEAMRARKADRLSIESDLRRALERDEIAIFYQPIIRLEDRSIAGFEALAALESSEIGSGIANRIHQYRRGNRADRRNRPCLFSTAQRDSFRPGNAPSVSAIRFSPASTSPRAKLLRHDLIQDLRTVLAPLAAHYRGFA